MKKESPLPNVHIISHIYPTKHDPSSGIFIQKEANILASIYEIAVWVPAVRAFPWQKQYQRSIDPVPESFDVKRVKYSSVPRRLLPTITINNLSTALIQSLSSSEADIIHLHWLFPAGLCIPKIKRALNKPIVLTLHGGDWYSNQNRGFDAMIEKSLIQVDAVICVGKQLTKDIITTYPSIKHKIHHIPHGIDCTKFKPVSKKEKEQVRKSLSWESNELHMLCVANFYEAKGVDILIDAFGKLPMNNKVHLHLIAPRRDKDVEKKILKLVDEHNLKAKVSIYSSMSEADLIQRYHAADFLVSPSRKEGFGLAIAEAISCGLPVVCTKSGGPEEIVNKKVGLFAEVNDSSSLANQIEKMLANYENYESESLHNCIKFNFGEETKLQRLNDIYADLS